MTSKTLETVLTDFELAASIIAGVAPIVVPGAGVAVGAGAAVAARLLISLQAGVQAHEALTGKPLDISVLHEIPQVT